MAHVLLSPAAALVLALGEDDDVAVTTVRMQDKLRGFTARWAWSSSDFEGRRSQDDHRSHFDASQVSDLGCIANAASHRAHTRPT